LRNSSFRMRPGCGLGIRLVVVDDFDVIGIAILPAEADAPLLIDADAIL
jgi:hypothetical protein